MKKLILCLLVVATLCMTGCMYGTPMPGPNDNSQAKPQEKYSHVSDHPLMKYFQYKYSAEEAWSCPVNQYQHKKVTFYSYGKTGEDADWWIDEDRSTADQLVIGVGSQSAPTSYYLFRIDETGFYTLVETDVDLKNHSDPYSNRVLNTYVTFLNQFAGHWQLTEQIGNDPAWAEIEFRMDGTAIADGKNCTWEIYDMGYRHVNITVKDGETILNQMDFETYETDTAYSYCYLQGDFYNTVYSNRDKFTQITKDNILTYFEVAFSQCQGSEANYKWVFALKEEYKNRFLYEKDAKVQYQYVLGEAEFEMDPVTKKMTFGQPTATDQVKTGDCFYESLVGYTDGFELESGWLGENTQGVTKSYPLDFRVTDFTGTLWIHNT